MTYAISALNMAQTCYLINLGLGILEMNHISCKNRVIIKSNKNESILKILMQEKERDVIKKHKAVRIPVNIYQRNKIYLLQSNQNNPVN